MAEDGWVLLEDDGSPQKLPFNSPAPLNSEATSEGILQKSALPAKERCGERSASEWVDLDEEALKALQLVETSQQSLSKPPLHTPPLAHAHRDSDSSGSVGRAHMPTHRRVHSGGGVFSHSVPGEKPPELSGGPRRSFEDCVGSGGVGGSQRTLHRYSPTSFLPSFWHEKGLRKRSDQFPNVPLVSKPPNGGGFKLVTHISPLISERGPRALQQDVGLVEGVCGGVPVVVMCDGHGSIPLLRVEQNRTPTEARDIVHVGGRQCAQIACEAIMEYIKSHAEEFQLHSSDQFMHHAFVHGHRAVLEQIRKGSNEDAEAASHSRLDGPYFRNTKKLIENLKAPEVSAVYRKVTRGTPDSGPDGGITFYQRNDGSWEHCDFGTTCTAVIVLNAPDQWNPNRKVALTAHAGDTDVCLLRFTKPGGKLKYAKWLTTEHNMFNDMERSREIVGGRRLADVEGEGKLARKVKVGVTLPTGEVSSVAYEPSRGLGHCQGQFLGIVPSPTVSCVELEADDTILIGTDGLWNALGGRRQKGDLSAPKEDLVSPLLPSLLHIVSGCLHKEAHEMARDIMGAAKNTHTGLNDNTSLIVIKVSERGVAHGMQRAGSHTNNMCSPPPKAPSPVRRDPSPSHHVPRANSSPVMATNRANSSPVQAVPSGPGGYFGMNSPTTHTPTQHLTWGGVQPQADPKACVSPFGGPYQRGVGGAPGMGGPLQPPMYM